MFKIRSDQKTSELGVKSPEFWILQKICPSRAHKYHHCVENEERQLLKTNLIWVRFLFSLFLKIETSVSSFFVKMMCTEFCFFFFCPNTPLLARKEEREAFRYPFGDNDIVSMLESCKENGSRKSRCIWLWAHPHFHSQYVCKVVAWQPVRCNWGCQLKKTRTFYKTLFCACDFARFEMESVSGDSVLA